MILRFFTKSKKSKWLPWVYEALITFLVAGNLLLGDYLNNIGSLAYFGSMFLRLFIGGEFAHYFSVRVLNTTADTTERFSSAGAIFTLFFLPALVGIFTNRYLDTNIELEPLRFYFLWACLAAGVFFLFIPDTSQK